MLKLSDDLIMLINQFNEKIDKLRKDSALFDALPGKINPNDIVINDKRDENRYKLALNRFLKMEIKAVDIGGARVTNWEKQETEREIKRINKIRETKRKKYGELEVIAGSKKVGVKLKDQPALGSKLNQFKEIKLPDYSVRKDWRTERLLGYIKEGEGYYEYTKRLFYDNMLLAISRNAMLSVEQKEILIKAFLQLSINAVNKRYFQYGDFTVGDVYLWNPQDEEHFIRILNKLR